MVYIRKHSAFLAISVLLAYFYIAQTSIQNKHTHFYPNGVVVTHSHPIDPSGDEPIENHKHSKTEICFFNTVHFDYYDTTKFVTIDFEQDEIHHNFLVRNEQFYGSVLSLTKAPRGPPV